jgi:hypothetical protein
VKRLLRRAKPGYGEDRSAYQNLRGSPKRERLLLIIRDKTTTAAATGNSISILIFSRVPDH